MQEVITLVAAPWEQEFFLRVGCAQRALQIACPFIKLRYARLLLATLPRTVQNVQVLTRFKEKEILTGVHDLEALWLFLAATNAKVEVRILNRLHTKLYIFDSDSAVITSTNLSHAGLNTNEELGVCLENSMLVQQCKSYFDQRWANAESLSMQVVEAKMLRLRPKMTEALRKEIKERISSKEALAEEMENYRGQLEDTASLDSAPIGPVIVDPTPLSAAVPDLARQEHAPEAVADSLYQAKQALEQVFGPPVELLDAAAIFLHSSVRQEASDLFAWEAYLGRRAQLTLIGDAAFPLVVMRKSLLEFRTTTANDLQLRFQALKEMRSHIKWLDALKLNLGIARDDVPAETVQTPIMPNLLAWLTINRGVEAALSAGEAMFDFTEDVPFESLEGLKPKSRLQEVVQAAYGTRPVYKVIEKSGPEYSLIFKVEVSIPSKAATGIGRSIKEAEATAAQNLLNVFDARETRRTPRRLSYLTERHLSDQEKVKLERFWNEVLVLTAKRSCRLSHAVALVGTPLRLRGFVQQNQRNQFSILGSAIIQLYAGLTAVENNAGRKFAVALCNRGNLERAFDQANLLEYACLGRIGDQTDHKYRVETMEAIMGYLFLYVGESASKRFFERIRAACSAVEVSNPKGKLLELIQAAIHAQPEIEYVVKKTGTNLGDNWKVVLRFRGHLFGTGEHRNKGEAEKQAAQQTLNDPRFQAMLEELRPSEGFGTADAPTAQS